MNDFDEQLSNEQLRPPTLVELFSWAGAEERQRNPARLKTEFRGGLVFNFPISSGSCTSVTVHASRSLYYYQRLLILVELIGFLLGKLPNFPSRITRREVTQVQDGFLHLKPKYAAESCQKQVFRTPGAISQIGDDGRFGIMSWLGS
jgi:hypothetical protein